MNKSIQHGGPLHPLIDTTGPRTYGKGERLEVKQGKGSRGRWREFCLNILDVGAVDLITDDVGDIAAVPDTYSDRRSDPIGRLRQ